ncbi:MAG TPA: hypothetical protein V6D10_22600 [Trichocoleus sp.]|jgi:hypothetical protein
MITIKTMKQIPTSRTIPSFRSTGARGSLRDRVIDYQRINQGYQKIVAQEILRQWRNQRCQPGNR